MLKFSSNVNECKPLGEGGGGGGGGGADSMREGSRVMHAVTVSQHDLLRAMGDVEPQHRAPQAGAYTRSH